MLYDILLLHNVLHLIYTVNFLMDYLIFSQIFAEKPAVRQAYLSFVPNKVGKC